MDKAHRYKVFNTVCSLRDPVPKLLVHRLYYFPLCIGAKKVQIFTPEPSKIVQKYYFFKHILIHSDYSDFHKFSFFFQAEDGIRDHA